tara:strand:+ start:3867 stop:5573 length:1707 start_codon:yes stop_codon:yes gene_type:complete
MARRKGKERLLSQQIEELASLEEGSGRLGRQLNTIYADLADNLSRVTKSTEKQKSSFNEQIDIGKKLLGNAKNIFNIDLQSEDLTEKIVDAKKRGSKAEQETLKNLQRNLNVQKELQKQGQMVVDEFNKGFDKTKEWAEGVPLIGDALGGLISKFDHFKDIYADAIGEGLAKFDGDEEAAKSFAGTKLGGVVGAGMLTGVAMFGKRALGIMQDLGISFGEVLGHPSFLLFKDEAMAITEEFGNINEASVGLTAQMKWMSFWTGVTADSQAKVLGAMAATSDASLSTLHSQISSTKQLAKAAGIPFKAVMEDVANNTKLFSEYAKDGGKNIMAAAVEAKAMGVSLSEVASISDSLLNFEEGIANQMEASMLLGREINLDRARQLNLAGDQAGMMKEIKAQVGSEAEFNKMNVLQRQALAGAIGLTTEELSKMVREEEKANENVIAKAALYIGLGAVIGAAIGMIATSLMATGVLAPVGAAIMGMMGPGAAIGAGIGAAAGAGAFAYGQGMLSFQGLKPGTGVNIQGGAAMAHAGETIVRTESINMDDTNSILIAGFDRMRKEYRNTQNG